MNELYIGAFLLTLLALASVLWPMRRRALVDSAATEAREEENVQLYREHHRELERSLAEGGIDQEQYQRLELELKRNLLADQAAIEQRRYQNKGRPLLLVTAALLVVGALWWYLERGSAADVELTRLQQQVAMDNFAAMQAGQQPDIEPTRALIQAIEARLKSRPDNTRYWYMLGRYASQVGDYQRAETGFRKVYEQSPNDPGAASELAQAIFLGNGNRINDEVNFLVDRALEGDSQDTTALGLAGIRAFEARNFRDAERYWLRAVESTPEGAPGRQALMAGVARARSEQGADGAPAPVSDSASWQIPLTVSLAEGLEAPAGATLFVFARQYNAGPMPLAVYRGPVPQFPESIILDETMAMTTKDRLMQEGQIELVARISSSGQAMPQPGDLQGSLGPLDMGALPEQITVKISERL